jgi:hypothetical protein
MNGPTNELLQLQNAATVIQRIDADVYALQEMSSDAAFVALVDTLTAAALDAEDSEHQLVKSSVLDLSGNPRP